MAGATSVISVAIVGDSKKFQKAVGQADKSAKNLGTSMRRTAIGIGAGIAGLFAVSKVFDVVGDAVNEADRLGDATANLNRIIGSVNTAKIAETADDFLKLGLSSQDVLELSVGFARIARAAGLSRGKIAKYATDVSATAQAMALVDEKGRTAATWIEIIGRAASKPATTRSMAALGLNLKETRVQAEALSATGKKSADSLTKQELAAARLKLIMEGLAPVLKDATANMSDLERQRAEMGARLEEGLGKFGVAITPGLIEIMDWLLKIVDEIPKWVEWFKLGFTTVQVALGVLGDQFRDSEVGKFLIWTQEQIPQWIEWFELGFDRVSKALGELVVDFQEGFAMAEGFVRDLLGPLATVAGIIDQIFGADHTATFTVVAPGTRISRNAPGSGPRNERNTTNDNRDFNNRNGVVNQRIGGLNS